MKVAIHEYMGKAGRLAEALAAAGHEVVPGHEVPPDAPADVFMIDLDPPIFAYRDLIDHHKAMGAKVLLYPHGVGPATEYDGLFEPYEHVDGRLVVGPGHVEFLRRIEYPHQAHAIGWSLSAQAPFRPCRDVRRVLFAPMHPSGAGVLAEPFRESNERVFARLLEGPWELTVRYIGTLEQNGLWDAEGVTYTSGGWTPATEEIDSADVVVAGDGTFPALAIARGAPTVITAQGLPPAYGLPDEQPTPLLRADRYRDYLRYPFDGDAESLEKTLRAAARSEAPIADWKRRFVGAPLDDASFATLIERIVLGPVAPPPLPDGEFVLGFADEVAERPELLERLPPAATLLLWAPGLDQPAAEALAAAHEGSTVALGFPSSDATDRALAERATALLSDWPSAGRVGALPRLA